MPSFLSSWAKRSEREVTLQLPAVLGRSREADVTVAHPLISRRHCEISESNGLLMLRDMASLNGTMIGGRRVESAPLLPDAEFMIGPLTFRVLYEYDGDLESVPDTRFVDAAEGTTEAGRGDPTSARAEEVPMLEVNAAVPAGPASEGDSGELAMPDFMALADADPEDVLSAPPRPATKAPRPARAGPKRPPAANDKRSSAPIVDSREEPLEVDSSLQSGAHFQESPWAAGPRTVGKPRPAPMAPIGKGPSTPAKNVPTTPAGKGPPETPPDVNSAEEADQPPAKQKPPANPPAARKPRKPADSDEMDPEFGSFLEDLQ